MKILQNTTVVFLQILLLPITLLAFAVVLIRWLAIKDLNKLSTTALAALFTKWLMHVFNIRKDPVSEELLSSLPNVSMIGLKISFLPAILANRISGFVPSSLLLPVANKASVNSLMVARTRLIDMAYEENKNSVGQIVVFGSGFDSRFYTFVENDPIKSFELDTEIVLDQKRRSLDWAEINNFKTSFIATDFSNNDWVNSLLENGFEKEKPSLFVFEGGTQQFEVSQLMEMLKAISKVSSKGSKLIFDFYSLHLLEGRQQFLSRFEKLLISIFGEKMNFGIEITEAPMVYVSNLLSRCNLGLSKMELIGNYSESTRPLGGFVQAVKL